MKKVVNFSHPLSPAAVAALENLMGDEVEIIDIPVQIDLSLAKVQPQIEAIIDEVPPGVDAIVPPGLSIVTALLCARLSFDQSDMMPEPPGIIVMKRTYLNQFIPTEIMRW